MKLKTLTENTKKTKCFVVLLAFCTFFLTAQTTFSGLDLNSTNGLLFSAETYSAEGVNYKRLYETQLASDTVNAASSSPVLLTCYPKTIDILLEGSLIQVKNESGIAQYNVTNETLSWVTGTPTLEKAATGIQNIIATATAVSPNGKWICSFKKTSPAYGSVVLTNAQTGEELILASNSEYRYDKVPVLWSPDSSSLIYEKDNQLYFLDPTQAFSSIQLSEEFRKIGKGLISNVYWATAKTLVYIDHDMVYTIGTNELYTRALYSEMIGVGKVIGRLPSAFDSQKDQFWTNADVSSLILVQANRTLFYMEIKGTDYDFVKTLFSYPFVNVPGTAISFSVFWTPQEKGLQIPYVWIELMRSGKTESYVYKLMYNNESQNTYFTSLPVPTFVSNPKLSPDLKSLAFKSEKNIHIYDLSTWVQKAVFTGENVITYSWVNKNSMYIGGNETVRLWEPYKNISKVLFLSSANTYGWDGTSGGIIVSNSAGNFIYNKTTNCWNATTTTIVRKAATQNPFWRVFLGDSKNKAYTNGIFVRSLTGQLETRALVSSFTKKTSEKPKVALVFDALDNADGLTPILSTLAKYNLKTTFFINGEFIRRFPSGVNEIVSSGHPCGSMFFTSADLNSSAYNVDESFVRRGLARNEDEFFALTGEELKLVWHAPFYRLSNAIINGGTEAGYDYAKSSIKTLDITTFEDTARNGIAYYPSSKIIEAITKTLKDGAIIPVSVGLSNGTRSDYLYQRLDVLIAAILDAGFEIVPVSELN